MQKDERKTNEVRVGELEEHPVMDRTQQKGSYVSVKLADDIQFVRILKL